jgi:prepilin peptidase CpaA
MMLSAWAAAWLLPVAAPICIYVAWSDMRSMKIPNVAVYALVGGFAALGLVALPLDAYLWRWLHLVVVLLIGMVLNAAGMIGAGDAKFAAAAAPFVAPGDLRLLLLLFAVCLVSGYIIHRIAKHSPARRLAPDWVSWDAGNRFPMGMPLGATLLFYLMLGLLQGT